MNEYEMAAVKLNEKGPDICNQIKEIFEPYNYMPPCIYDKNEDRAKNEDKMLFYIGKHMEYMGYAGKPLLISSINSLKKEQSRGVEKVLVGSMESANNMAGYGADIIKSVTDEQSLYSTKTNLFPLKLDFGFWAYPEFVLWNVLYNFFWDIAYTHLIEAFKIGLFMMVSSNGCVYAIPFPKCYMNQNRNVHNSSGPAIIWHDGEKAYYLNGVKVTQEIVETPAEGLDPHILLEERNAEVRREIVRKIGIERVCDTLKAKVIDRQGGYELLRLYLGDMRRRTYLKMKNPSTGCYHIEGVSPNIKTVKEALSWRNRTVESPIDLT